MRIDLAFIGESGRRGDLGKVSGGELWGPKYHSTAFLVNEYEAIPE